MKLRLRVGWLNRLVLRTTGLSQRANTDRILWLGLELGLLSVDRGVERLLTAS